MPGNPVAIGPFNDGLNNVSTSGEAKDSEVVELINMEVGEDGSLRSRPPFQHVPGTYIDGTVVDNRFKVHGIYQFSNTEWYLMCSRPTGPAACEIIAVPYGDFSLTIIQIAVLSNNNSYVTGFAQVDDWAYFCMNPASTANGFRWHKATGFQTLAAMPKGTTMCSYKSRLWIAGQTAASLNSRLYFSTIDTVGYKPDQWNTAVDYFDVAAGEGGFITALLPLSSSILIFKDAGTYRFSYGASVKGGQVDKVNGSIGAATASSVVEYENYVYVYDQGRLYELVNNTYRQLNRFVKFESDSGAADGTAASVDVSVVNRRVIIRYLNALYAYAIDTQSWSQWRTLHGTPGRFVECPADSTVAGASKYIAPSMGALQNLGSNEINTFNAAYASYMATIPEDTSVTFNANVMTVNVNTGIGYAYLNNSGGDKNYNIRLTSGSRFKLQGSITRTGSYSTFNAVMEYLKADGTTVSTFRPLSAASSFTVNENFVAPDGTIAALCYIAMNVGVSGPAATFTMQGMSLNRYVVESPVKLISIKDEYESTPNVVEFIDCIMKTKSYDYKVPSAYKRLFWWAADLKSTQPVTATLIPVAVKQRPTYGDLQAYTHAQLSAGTWGNPLKFLQEVLDVQDGADPSNAQTENGRILMKFKKSIRFKQASFKLAMSSFGNKASGPIKIHNLVTFVQTKEKVTDRTN